MKAWLAQIKGWPEADSIVGGETRGKARIKVFLAAVEVGFQVKIGTIRVTRRPDCDQWIEAHPGARCWDRRHVERILAERASEQVSNPS